MAVVNGKTDHIQHSVLKTVWSPLLNGDTGTFEQLSRYPVHSVTFAGTFGAGGTIVLEGSDDGVNFFTLTAEGGQAAPTVDRIISATAADRFDFANVVPLHIRPRVTGGDGSTSLTVTLISRQYGH